jgi:hypothetical protein
MADYRRAFIQMGKAFGKTLQIVQGTHSGVSSHFHGVLDEYISEMDKAFVEKYVLFPPPLVSTEARTMTAFEQVMHEKQNHQYGPPQRRTHMRHRHHR